MAVEQPCANCSLEVGLARVTEALLEVEQCLCAASVEATVSSVVGGPAEKMAGELALRWGQSLRLKRFVDFADIRVRLPSDGPAYLSLVID
jgi:hypothetical protein